MIIGGGVTGGGGRCRIITMKEKKGWRREWIQSNELGGNGDGSGGRISRIINGGGGGGVGGQR